MIKYACYIHMEFALFFRGAGEKHDLRSSDVVEILRRVPDFF